MTYFELSLRNARRQAKDYLIYFVTVILAAALLYAFNGLVFSQELRQLSQMMDSLPLVITLGSAAVVCIFGWLVSYTTGFMLARRSRELGTYILIGLTNRQVARLFFLENLAVGGCALAVGMLMGELLYQALRSIVLAMFGWPYSFGLSFSLPAIGLTLLYFALIYFYALRKSRRRIRKMKIHDLIYFERQNEEAVIGSGKNRRRVFAASIILGVIGTLLLMVGDLYLGVAGALCITAFLYGFFLSFASGVPAFFDKRPARKYRGENLLVFRTLTAKLAAMGVTMATISLLLTATLLCEGSGLVFRGIAEGRAAETACFDLFISLNEQHTFTPYLCYIDENIQTEKSLQYPVYVSEDAEIMQYLDAHTVYYHDDYEQDPVIRFSDYAALRELAGYPPVQLQPGQYLLHCSVYLGETLDGYTRPLSLSGETLTRGGIFTGHLLQRSGAGNGNGYLLVVPDEAARGLALHHLAYAAKTARPVSEQHYDRLAAINEQQNDAFHQDEIYTKAHEIAQAAAQTAVIVFPLYYLALALTMTAAAILSIQQLSEAGRWQRQFSLLGHLGMGRREMVRALRTQLSIYYAMPAVPPVLIGVPFIFHLARLPEAGVMVGASSPAAVVIIALALFLLIYLFYILLAYLSLRRSVLPE